MEKENVEIDEEQTEPWTAEELAQLLGLKKKATNGEKTVELDPNGLLQQFVMGQIASFEQYKKQKRMAPIINPFKS